MADAEPTLLVYNSCARLLAGDLLHTVTVADVRADLAHFPADWPVVGVGTTDWIGRNGEMMPDGTSRALRFWWADPSSPSHAAVHDDADPAYVRSLGHAVRFPFLGLAIGDPRQCQEWRVQDVPDLHDWLRARLTDAEIELAGLQLHGRLGAVKTTDTYNLPLTGLDLCGGYVGNDHFRFVDYPPGTWTVNGLWALDPALQLLVSVGDLPLHLHGYEPAIMRGGHIGTAAVEDATVRVWPLTTVVPRRGHLTPNAPAAPGGGPASSQAGD
jgi:hypothetical protein